MGPIVLPSSSQLPTLRRNNNNHNNSRLPLSAGGGGGGNINSGRMDAIKARLFLAVACFWPLGLIALLAASSPHVSDPSLLATTTQYQRNVANSFRTTFRNVLDRVDVMGYGPTHPRIAVAVVGEDKENLISTVESIFSKTDMNRIFVVAVVVDGHKEDYELLARFKKMDEGHVPHWHGMRPDVHVQPKTEEDEDDLHGHKVHVMFNSEKRGVAESRADCVEFIRLLQKHHESAGLKSLQEDLILVLLQGGAQLVDRSWLDTVTTALIVPPPLMPADASSSSSGQGVAMKIANAVSFNLEGRAKCTGFDTTFTPVIMDADPTEINFSSGSSYPTPALNGAAVAMRLDTYLNLPLQDLNLEDAWAANLDLSLNLWLCADGIDMLQGVDVATLEPIPPGPLGPEMAARFAAAWMDDVTGRKFFNAYTKTYKDVTFLEWQTYMAHARENPTFTANLPTRCRSFRWYAEKINTDLNDMLTASENIPIPVPPQPQGDVPVRKVDAMMANQVQPIAQPADQALKAAADAAAAVMKVLQQPKPVVEVAQRVADDAAEEEEDQDHEDEDEPEDEDRSKPAPAEEDEKAESGEQPKEEEEEAAEQAQVKEEVKVNEPVKEQPDEGAAEQAKEEDVKVSEPAKDEPEEGAAEQAKEEEDVKDSEPAKDEPEDGAAEQAKGEEDVKDSEPAKDEPEEGAAKQANEQPEEGAAEQAKEEDVKVNEPAKEPENQADHNDDAAIPERQDKRKPAKPLCPECLQIVQQAHPVDISYVDVSEGHVDHPHMGATDEEGNLGFIHDETALRKNPQPFRVDDEVKNECSKRDNNYKMLTERVFVDTEYDKQMEQSGKSRPKIFCLVYTIEQGHPKIPLILETWGPKCDGFMVGSNKTDTTIGAVNIVHQGPEEYNNIWQKVRSMWSYIYDNYYEKYDWFHIGGDDLYLIVENLRYYLESEEIQTAGNGGIFLPDGSEKVQTPLFLGRRFAYQGDMNDIFNSGGSGYTMNKAALKTLVVEGFPKYFPNAHTFSEDTMVAHILRNYGIFPYETKDEDGGERYNPFMPGHHWGYRLPADRNSDWYARYSINIKEGPEHCSPRSVAFHYVKGPAMRRLHALLYHMCPAETA